MTLIRELYGRANLGQGALKTEGIDIKVFPIISLDLFEKENEKELKEILQSISSRPITDIKQEVKKDDRRKLDQYWSSLLGIEEEGLVLTSATES